MRGYQHYESVVIPQNSLFAPRSGGKENLCGIRFLFFRKTKSDSGYIFFRLLRSRKENIPE
jgi:hypothetical protein